MGWIELPEELVMKFSAPGSRWRMIFDAAYLVYLIVKVLPPFSLPTQVFVESCVTSPSFVSSVM